LTLLNYRRQEPPRGLSLDDYKKLEDQEMLKGMRKYAFVAAATTAFFVVPISAFSQSIEVGPGGVRVYDGRGVGNASNCGVPAKIRTR
jgi:hypothetical protein